MRGSRRISQLWLPALAAVLLTLLTGVFGAPFVRLLRHSQGGPVFWALGAVITALFFGTGAGAAGVFVASVWITVGAYSEFENRGWGWKRASALSLSLGALAGAAAFAALLKQAGIVTWDAFVALVSEKTALVLPPDLASTADISVLVQQIPSAWVILLVLCLGNALIFERRLFAWFGLPRERVASGLRLLEFRLPDPLLWITLTAFLVTMVNFDSKALAAVGANVVNVSVVLYFFQGLAVLEVLLNSMRAGAFMRMAVYVILVGQLFFVLSAVGLIDFWVDFRRRLPGSGKRAGNDHRAGGSV